MIKKKSRLNLHPERMVNRMEEQKKQKKFIKPRKPKQPKKQKIKKGTPAVE